MEPLTTEAATRLIEARSPGMAAHARQGLLDLAQGNPLALLELPSTVTGQDVARDRSDVVPLSERLQAIFTDRIAEESAFSLVTLPCRDFSAVIRISALV